MSALRLAVIALAVASLAAVGHAGKIIVDASGGAGSHFTDIPPAIAAAQPGDLILVRIGTYSNFVLDKGLTILGEGDSQSANNSARVSSAMIANVPVGLPAVIVNLWTSGIVVENVQATVVLEDVSTLGGARVFGSRDVRMHQMAAYVAALGVIGSRLEIVDSTVYGLGGSNGQSGNLLWPAGDGGPGLVIGEFGTPSGRVHLAMTSCFGGSGGWYSKAGDGGMGVYVSSKGELIVSGSGSAVIQGGTGGYGDECYLDGNGGDGLVNDGGQVIRSGVTLIGGPVVDCGMVGIAHVYMPDPDSFDINLTAWDPTLVLLGQPIPGQPLDVKLNARDGSKAFVLFGTQPVLRPDALTHVEQLVTANRRDVAFLGTVTANNQVVFQLPIAPTAQQGELFFLQGTIVLPSGQVRRTNSVPVFVR